MYDFYQYIIYILFSRKYLNSYCVVQRANMFIFIRLSCIGSSFFCISINAEYYYMKMLLHTVKGPTSCKVLKTANEEIFEIYKEACYPLVLLETISIWTRNWQKKHSCVFPHKFAGYLQLF